MPPKRNTTKAAAANRLGRPRSAKPLRQYIRCEGAELVAWRRAAARAGLQLAAWLEATVNAEARKPTHVPALGAS